MTSEVVYLPPEDPNDPQNGGLFRISAEADVDPNNEFFRASSVPAELVLALLKTDWYEVVRDIAETQDASTGRLKVLRLHAALTGLQMEFRQIGDPGATIEFPSPS